MSPILANQVTNQSSIQRLGRDATRRALAFLLTAYGGGAYGQSPVTGSPNTSVLSQAKAVASKFQGFNDEQFLDALTYQTAISLRAFNPAGPGGPPLPTLTPGVGGVVDGFALDALVSTFWGGPAGIVDSQEVDALILYGQLLQAGFNFSNILTT